jgi:hypothetical protein
MNVAGSTIPPVPMAMADIFRLKSGEAGQGTATQLKNGPGELPTPSLCLVLGDFDGAILD